jgi:hypothetical protein
LNYTASNIHTAKKPNRFNDLEAMSNLALPYIYTLALPYIYRLADGQRNVASGEDGDRNLWTPSNESINMMS